MKRFATFTLVVSIIGSLLSVLAMFTGNEAESASGAVILGSSFGGILMSCLVIAVVDIRDILKRREDNAV